MAEGGDIQTEGDTSPDTLSLEWNSTKYVLDNFDNETNLPQLARFKEDDSKGKLPPGLKIFSEQPALLYKRCSKKQVRARTIYKDKTGAYFEVGQTIIIPEDYDGWFEMVPQHFGRGSYCKTIGEIAEVMPRKFFTRSNIRGIRIIEDENGEQKFAERKISAGTVIQVVSTFSAKWKTCAETGIRKKKKEEWETYEVKYLKCIDLDEKEILIPFTTQGKFNIVYEKSCDDNRSVFRIKDLVSDFDFPLKVRLLFGKAPVVPCIFTGVLVLKEHKQEDTIIGSTAMQRRNVLFEIPVKSSCYIETAQDEEKYETIKSYSDARKLCHKYAHSYSTLMKLSPDLDTSQQMIQHIPTVKPKREDILRTLDLITNISLTDDEPINIFMESDRDSINSSEQSPMPKSGMLMELKEMKSDKSNRKSSSVV